MENEKVMQEILVKLTDMDKRMKEIKTGTSEIKEGFDSLRDKQKMCIAELENILDKLDERDRILGRK